MGIIKKIFGGTNLYRSLVERKAKKEKQQLDKKLFPVRKNFYRQFIKKGDLVFDVGANEGNRIDIFQDLECRIVAVEPQPGCVNILKSKFGGSIKIEQIGLSDVEGELTMRIANDSTISSFSDEFIKRTSKERFKNYSWQNEIKVPVSTFDHLIGKYGVPEFCKIDVEGFELQVLNGLSQSVPHLSFEYCIPEMQDNLQACLARLYSINSSSLFNFSTEESMSFSLSEWMNYDDFSYYTKQETFIKTSFGDVYCRMPV